jgi:hypothetical protein
MWSHSFLAEERVQHAFDTAEKHREAQGGRTARRGVSDPLANRILHRLSSQARDLAKGAMNKARTLSASRPGRSTPATEAG